jgi:uncharacterized damage-inducible protein DinB
MYHTVSEFLGDWKRESDVTGKIFANLTDKSLKQKVSPDGRDLGFIAWHIVITIGEMMNKSGLDVKAPAEDSEPPATAKEIQEAYTISSQSLIEEIQKKWKDSIMQEDIDMYGQKWKGWLLCNALIKHEIHHRAQMTVLMRQAGLKVPGAYGPSREEWTALGMPEAR